MRALLLNAIDPLRNNKLVIKIAIGIILVFTLLSLLFLAYIVGEPTFNKIDKIIIIARDEEQVSNPLLEFIETHYTSQNTSQRVEIISYFTHGVIGRANYFLEKHKNDNSVLGYVMLIDDLEFRGIDFSLLVNKTVFFVNTFLMINRLGFENISYLSPSTLEAFRFIKLQMYKRNLWDACIVSRYDAISINTALELYHLFKTRGYNSRIVFSVDDCDENLYKVLVIIDIIDSTLNLTWRSGEKYELIFLITNFNIPLRMSVDRQNLYIVFRELLASSNKSLLPEFINICDNLSLQRCTYIDYLTYKAILNLLKNRGSRE